MLSPEQLRSLKRMADTAREVSRVYGVPPELTLAQCIVESSWFKKAPGNNCFGIKAADRHTATQSFVTTEVIEGKIVPLNLKFAVYPNIRACFLDHDWLISHGAPYAKAWAEYQRTQDVNKLIDNIAPVYATGPKYAALLKAILSMEDVKNALAGTLQPPPAVT